jgi:hypothetical protein
MAQDGPIRDGTSPCRRNKSAGSVDDRRRNYLSRRIQLARRHCKRPAHPSNRSARRVGRNCRTELALGGVHKRSCRCLPWSSSRGILEGLQVRKKHEIVWHVAMGAGNRPPCRTPFRSSKVSDRSTGERRRVESLESFKLNLKNNLYNVWNRMSFARTISIAREDSKDTHENRPGKLADDNTHPLLRRKRSGRPFTTK